MHVASVDAGNGAGYGPANVSPKRARRMKLASQAVFAVAAAAAVAGVLYLLVSASTPSDGMEIALPTPAPSDIQVYVTGAVREPGVYTVGADARLATAVEAAGGVTDEADLYAVNLAARLVDEAHWHIPTRGEAAAPAQQAGKAAAGKIDINSAGVDSLVSLPQIGRRQGGRDSRVPRGERSVRLQPRTS